ncbi:MAG: sialidase, partial [Blastocatellia bacterium]|nr:sialidase [Blastocatellia bacterium]
MRRTLFSFRILSFRIMTLSLLAPILAAIGLSGWAQEVTPALYRSLEYRYIGPVGNRISAVAGVPGDPLVYYAGSASGGIFKSADGGVTWAPIFDDQPVSSIGALAVAPSNPNIVWAGTGESWIRSHISLGMGVYKSTDAGKKWKLMGLEETGRIARVVIDPKNPDIVFAAAMGHSYGPQQERGLFRTTDGGQTWRRVLFVDENTGCSDVVMDPSNPQILFAGMWQFEIHTWRQMSGGPGSGIFMSRDGGSTWARLNGHGLPEQEELGKIGLAIAPGNPRRIYAIIETGTGEPWKGKTTASGYLWRSDDGGEKWKQMTPSHDVGGRTHYYSRMAIEPDNENQLYFLTASYSRSDDGGATLRVMRGYPDT